MRILSLALSGIAVAFVAGHFAGAQENTDKISWTASFSDALAKAKESKQPLMISVLAGPEEDHAPFLNSLEDGKVRELSAKVVCVPVCEGTHGGGADGECTVFAGVTCAQHTANFAELAKKRLLPGTRRVAQHLFLDARGKQLFKRGFGFEGDDGDSSLARRMNIAIAAVNKSEMDAELAEAESFRMEVLLNRVRDRDPEGRRAASAVLGNSDDPKALKAVQAAAKTTGNDDDRAAIYEALAIRGNWSALQLCMAGLGDRDIMVRLAAVNTIEKIDMPEAATTLVKQSAKDRSLLPAAMAIKGACFLDPEDKKVVSAALKTSSHNRVALRIGACWGMSEMPGNQSVIGRLRHMVRNDKEVNARAAAAWALGILGEALDAQSIAKQLEDEKNAPERPKEVMAAAIERLNGSTRGDYDELIESLLAIEAYDDIADGSDDNRNKGKWGKWAGKYGKGKGKGGGWGGGGWGKGGWGGGKGGKGK